MIGTIISLYLIIMLLLCFVKVRFGIAMYLLYQILVPFVSIKFGSLQFGQNLVNTVILVALFAAYFDKIKYFEYKSLMPFLFLFVSQFLLIPFHPERMPISEQLNNFRLDIMSSLLLPFAMINVMKFDRNAYKLFRNVLLIGILIAVLYGMFLTTIPGINPWLIVTLPLNNLEFNDTYALAESGGRLFGRISSVFSHPMTFGLFLCLAFVFTYSLIQPKSKTIIYFLLLALIIVAIIICGIRTPIGALFVVVGFYLLMLRKFKFLVYVAVSILIIYFIISQFPDLYAYISSIFDSESSAVSGSSSQMRIEQLNGSFDIIKNNKLTGLGYGWTGYYQSLHGDHPVMLAFESLLYVVICDNGYVGIIIWIVMFFLYYRYVSNHFDKNRRYILFSLMIAYFIYSLITGEYGYLKYFLIFYVLILGGQNKEKAILGRKEYLRKRVYVENNNSSKRKYKIR